MPDGKPYADELRVADDVDTAVTAIADHASIREESA